MEFVSRITKRIIQVATTMGTYIPRLPMRKPHAQNSSQVLFKSKMRRLAWNLRRADLRASEAVFTFTTIARPNGSELTFDEADDLELEEVIRDTQIMSRAYVYCAAEVSDAVLEDARVK